MSQEKIYAVYTQGKNDETYLATKHGYLVTSEGMGGIKTGSLSELKVFKSAMELNYKFNKFGFCEVVTKNGLTSIKQV